MIYRKIGCRRTLVEDSVVISRPDLRARPTGSSPRASSLGNLASDRVGTPSGHVRLSGSSRQERSLIFFLSAWQIGAQF